MALDSWALVKDGKVINIIVWDPEQNPEWRPQQGVTAVAHEVEAAIGVDFINGKFVDNRPQPLPVDLAVFKQQYVARIDEAFRHLAAGMFVDPTKREDMRLKAVALADAVLASATVEVATTAMERGLTQLKMDGGRTE